MTPANLTFEHLHHLCVEIGARPSGSPGNHAAAEYIARVFRSAGLQVEEQRYTCPNWELGETRLEVNGVRLAAAANVFSPSCDVTAPVVAVSTIAELAAANLSGRIGILYGDLTRAPLACKAWFLKSERDDQIVRLLEQKSPVALLTVQTFTREMERLIEDWEFAIPSATITADAGLTILTQDNVSACLRIVSRQAPGYSGNVVGRTAGVCSSRIVLCAHYDTKFDTPGAIDNGAGVAALLTLAQMCARQRDLEFIAFSGEEYLPLGDDEYLRRCGDSFDRLVAAINLDGIGASVGANTITTVSVPQALRDGLVALTKRYPGVVWVEPWYESNHSTFARRGIPSIAFSSVGAWNRAHLRTDTIEWISPRRMEEIVSLIADIIEFLQKNSENP